MKSDQFMNMKFTCKCLNFIVEVQSYLKKISIEITSEEASHPYFKKDVLQLTGDVNSKSEVYPGLIKSKVVGSWNIYQCFGCQMYTSATNYVTGLETSSSCLKELIDFKSAGKNEGWTYSKVFQICIPTVLTIPEHFKFPIPGHEILDHRVLELIDKKTNDFLKMAELKCEGSSEDERFSLEAAKKRVLCEKKFILELLINAKDEILERNSLDAKDSSKSPQMFGSQPKTPRRLKAEENSDEGLEVNFGKLELSSRKKERRHEYGDPNEEMFRMDDDDLELYEPNEKQSSDNGDALDSDDDFEETFGREYPDPPKEFLGRSVPLDIPSLSRSYQQPRYDSSDDNRSPMEPQAIAASMKELARNMRLSSVDVFGDLPRRPPPKEHNYLRF